ncbi:hypothetical protein [Tenggerimyces flavus]|uniref:Uncharacterized protein n=1 Tax=Tenggerimyces flavus TaxID=1708749 RepID=A0ABV7YGV2_9ACTN|nr:hypothetical protein [Tenggerimyces flavus]MBM7789278.1 hypothetical protein [Tenggerimyces flavus]
MSTLRLLALAALLGTLFAVPQSAASAAADRITGMVADYSGGNTIGAELREKMPRADGYKHIDVERTIRKLQELNVNSYLFLIWRSPADWGDLARFLPQARQAGVDVWVYLVPPSECFAPGTPDRCSYPYKTDYIAWAKAIANLSRQHANLAGWMIDDFGHNLEGSGRKPSFTPAYLGQIQAAAKAINKDLPFLPLLYTYQVTKDFLDKYAGFIDGITLAYKDDPARNTVMTHTLRPQLDGVLKTIAPYDMPVVLMLYAGRYTASPLLPSTPYVRTVIDQGLGYLQRKQTAGIVAYGVQFDGASAQQTERKAKTGNGRLSLALASHVATPGLNYIEASQTVRFSTTTNQHKVTFAHRDHRGTTGTNGQHQMQLLLDNQVVWTRTVSDETGSWQTTTVDLTQAAKGKSTAKLAFRLTNTTPVVNSAVDIAIDDLTGQGLTIRNPGFEDATIWQLARYGGRYVVGIDIYDPQRPRHTFELIQQRFAPYE